MQTILIIGCGAIGEAVVGYLAGNPAAAIGAAIIEPGTEAHARDVFGDGVQLGHDINAITTPIDLAVECAGHPALRQHGAAILARGTDLITVSSGALGDPALYDELAAAASKGKSQLRVVSGAIGALDALAAASVGNLAAVTYRGRKPPQGWRGSPSILTRLPGQPRISQAVPEMPRSSIRRMPTSLHPWRWRASAWTRRSSS